MLKVSLRLILIFSLSLSLYAQKKSHIIKGSVIDSIGLVIDANIINLNTKDGTFANDFGRFKIRVRLGDTLLISSVQHYTKKHIVKKEEFNSKKVSIQLTTNSYELDEVVLKENNLSKRLAIDAKKRKKDLSEKKADEFKKILEEAPKAGVTKSIGSQPEDRGLAGEITRRVDPTKSFRGFGFGFGLGKRKNKTKIKISKLNEKNRFHNNVIKKVTLDFFKTLKIPKNLITHFLSNCDEIKIKELLRNDKTLELMKYLKKVSNRYLNKRLIENKQ